MASKGDDNDMMGLVHVVETDETIVEDLNKKATTLCSDKNDTGKDVCRVTDDNKRSTMLRRVGMDMLQCITRAVYSIRRRLERRKNDDNMIEFQESMRINYCTIEELDKMKYLLYADTEDATELSRKKRISDMMREIGIKVSEPFVNLIYAIHRESRTLEQTLEYKVDAGRNHCQREVIDLREKLKVIEEEERRFVLNLDKVIIRVVKGFDSVAEGLETVRKMITDRNARAELRLVEEQDIQAKSIQDLIDAIWKLRDFCMTNRESIKKMKQLMEVRHDESILLIDAALQELNESRYKNALDITELCLLLRDRCEGYKNAMRYRVRTLTERQRDATEMIQILERSLYDRNLWEGFALY